MERYSEPIMYVKKCNNNGNYGNGGQQGKAKEGFRQSLGVLGGHQEISGAFKWCFRGYQGV